MPGISWQCASQTHGTCEDKDCRCRCHFSASELLDRVPRDLNQLPTPPNNLNVLELTHTLKCPTCGTPVTPSDKFCRKDGTSLSQTHCPQCNSKTSNSDLYCFNCGSPLSTEISSTTTA